MMQTLPSAPQLNANAWEKTSFRHSTSHASRTEQLAGYGNAEYCASAAVRSKTSMNSGCTASEEPESDLGKGVDAALLAPSPVKAEVTRLGRSQPNPTLAEQLAEQTGKAKIQLTDVESCTSGPQNGSAQDQSGLEAPKSTLQKWDSHALALEECHSGLKKRPINTTPDANNLLRQVTTDALMLSSTGPTDAFDELEAMMHEIAQGSNLQVPLQPNSQVRCISVSGWSGPACKHPTQHMGPRC
jgi:hypothetical protein